MYCLFIICTTFLYVHSESATQARIINGRSIDIADVPFQLMLTYDDEFYCGAVLISPNHVLTAAHCLYDGNFRSKQKISIFAGVTTQNQRYEEGQVYGVRKYVIHWNFFLTLLHGDIAIIFPSSRIKVNGITVKPIALATQNYKTGYKALASGWGMTDDEGSMPDDLQATLVTSVKCHVFRDSICARGRSGICKGDSGGPLVFQKRLIGIARAKISTNGKCRSQSEIYTSVYYYRDFIRRYTNM